MQKKRGKEERVRRDKKGGMLRGEGAGRGKSLFFKDLCRN